MHTPILTGIIPADVGSTEGRPRIGPLPRDHPRGCGEHSELEKTVSSFKGSSPRMRGAPTYVLVALVEQRIIPADAGST